MCTLSRIASTGARQPVSRRRRKRAFQLSKRSITTCIRLYACCFPRFIRMEKVSTRRRDAALARRWAAGVVLSRYGVYCVYLRSRLSSSSPISLSTWAA